MPVKPVFYLGDGARRKPGSKLWRIPVIRCGRWDYPKPGEFGFEVTPTTLHELKDNFYAGIMGPRVPLNLNHKDGADCGWVEGLEIDGATLFALCDVTKKDVEQDLEDGTLRFSSAELDFERVCPERSATLGDRKAYKVLEGLALTNTPYVKGMGEITPIVLCDRVDVRRAAVLLSDRATLAAGQFHFPAPAGADKSSGGPPEETKTGGEMPQTLEEAQAEITALKAKLSENAADQESGIAALKLSTNLANQIALRDVEDTVRKLVRRKLPPAAANRFLRLSELLIMGGARTVTLTEKIAPSKKYRLAEGDADPIDKLDVIGEIVAMLGELPDAVAAAAGDVRLAEQDDPTEEDAKNEEEKLIELADKLQAESGKDNGGQFRLSRRAAFSQARRQLKESKRGGN